jgi:hypothetical protein
MDVWRELSGFEQMESLRSLAAGLILAGLSIEQLGVDALTLDGALSGPQTAAVLAGNRRCTAHEHDVLAQAINDHLVGRGGDHTVRYSDELGGVGGN